MSTAETTLSEPSAPAARAAPSLVAALFSPETAMERVAREGRVLLPLGLAIACALFAGGTAGLRVDAHASTLERLDKAGELKTMSDKAVEDAQKADERAYIVKRVAGGLFGPPVLLLASAAGLFAISWFARGRMKAGPLFAVCAASLLPGALANLLDGGAALLRSTVAADGQPLVPHTLAAMFAASSHALHDPLARVASALDFFSLWGALLLAFGLSAAAALPARRAVPATLFAWALWRLVTHVAVGG